MWNLRSKCNKKEKNRNVQNVVYRKTFEISWPEEISRRIIEKRKLWQIYKKYRKMHRDRTYGHIVVLSLKPIIEFNYVVGKNL